MKCHGPASPEPCETLVAASFSTRLGCSAVAVGPAPCRVVTHWRVSWTGGANSSGYFQVCTVGMAAEGFPSAAAAAAAASSCLLLLLWL